MSTLGRIRRFERLRLIDVRKQDELGGKMAVGSQRIAELHFQISQLERERNTAMAEELSVNPAGRIQLQIWLEHSHSQTQSLQSTLVEQQQQWNEWKRQWQQQSMRVKAWDRLLVRLQQRLTHQDQQREMQQADEMATQTAYRRSGN